MGFLKKAIKRVTKTIKKVVKQSADPVGAVGALSNRGQSAQAVDSEAASPSAPAPAQLIEAPKETDVDSEDSDQTESDKKKARAGGKKSLSVARSSGGGLNI